jgi:hypothetical protein
VARSEGRGVSEALIEIEARVLPEITLPGRGLERRDVSIGYRRAGLVLSASFDVFKVAPAALAELQADPWVDVRNVAEMGADAIASARRNRVDRLEIKRNGLERDLIAARERYQVLSRAPEGSAQRGQAARLRVELDRLEADIKATVEAKELAALEAEEAEKTARPPAKLTPIRDATKAATPSQEGLRAAYGGTLPGTTQGSEFLAKQGAAVAGKPPEAPAPKQTRKSA